MNSIPILSIRLLDLPIADDPQAKKRQLNTAKDLLKAFPAQCHRQGVDPDDFHNQQVRYSGIQLGRYQGKVEWMAIGHKAVNALTLWYQLFSTSQPQHTQNIIETKEYYTPSFLSEPQPYHIAPLLISDQLAKRLNTIHHRPLYHKQLEKYLFGNLMTFFQHIGFSYDKKVNFLHVHLLEVTPFNQALPVYHRQKKTAFRLRFQCNFHLPQHLRLGQSTAIGYGRLRHLTPKYDRAFNEGMTI